MKVTHYDLFAGIGGFSYALDTIFNEHEINHIFCEWEAFPTAVLKKHWPNSVYYGDIQELIKELECQRQENAQNADKQTTLSHQTQRENGQVVTVGNVKVSTINSGEQKTPKNNQQQESDGGTKTEEKLLKCTGENVSVAENKTLRSLPLTTLTKMEQKKEEQSNFDW